MNHVKTKKILFVVTVLFILGACQRPKSELLRPLPEQSASNNFQTTLMGPRDTPVFGADQAPRSDGDMNGQDDPTGNHGRHYATEPGSPPIPTDDQFFDDNLYLPPRLPLNIAVPMCGNGIQEYGEECDLGRDINFLNIMGCNRFCRLPYCGNLITDRGEECDDGNHDDCDGCDSRCLYEACGNLRLDCIQKEPLIREECDDGNKTAGDGCSPCCRFEICGNHIVDPAEQCDDGEHNGQPGYNCSKDCTIITCPAGLTCFATGATCPVATTPCPATDIE